MAGPANTPLLEAGSTSAADEKEELEEDEDEDEDVAGPTSNSVTAATGLGSEACSTVVGAMALHRSCSEVVRHGALALAKLCLDPTMQAAASECGAVAMLTVFLRKETQCLRSDLPHVCCALANVGANGACAGGQPRGP